MEINMEQTKIWKVKNNELVPIKRQFLPKEEMIQKWVESDISIISDDLIFIGSKVITDHNKEIDILAIDSEGDLVIFEKEVKVAIVDTITNGAPECTFIIDYA